MKLKHNPGLFLLVLSACAGTVFIADAAPADTPLRPVGVARVDITPDYPVRLIGYGARREESSGVAQRLFAKALAFGSDADGPAMLITVDNCAVPGAMRDEVVRRLAAKTKIVSERFTVCSTHNHSGPMLVGVLPNMFSAELPAEQQARVERYTRELTDKIEQVALAALADRQPARLAWGVGRVGFAANRRLFKDGKWVGFGDNLSAPVDHDLPVLRASGADGKVRAVFTSYACHCTTLSSPFNEIHGDWAGSAQEALEREFPGAVALIAIGCGADANPSPRGELAMAVQHGETLATEAKRLLTGELAPLAGALQCRAKRIELAFDTPRTRAEWEQLAQDKSPLSAYYARKQLARLDRGEQLPTTLPYFVQTWTFGDDLAMVFLPGEVVVDYSLRLKRELGAKLWVNGYSNDVPCYIPSRRILKEGGYEAEGAMTYYDQPARLAPEVEENIIGAVHELMPKGFAAPASPPESLKSALLFHASFDQNVDANFAVGDAKLYAMTDRAKRTEAKPGLPEEGLVQLDKEAGRFGGALHFTQKMKSQVFFRGAKNLGYRAQNWSGACSFWLRLDPDKDLEPGYCDPLQFVAQAWGEGNMFVEFSKDHTPRHFRYALLPVTRLWNPTNRKWEDIPEPERPMVPVHQPPFSREKWTHVCFTFGNANTGKKDGWGKLYLDGKLQGAFTGFDSSFNWDDSQSALTLGLNYIGWFDDVAVFNRALTDAEVLAVFQEKDGVGSLK